ncbi:MAG: zf-HC2 domain-containing protein [Fimbriimonadaceae bacterium]|nr:zf-HC2 domain-containing protein [Fimbriimonadaceae bacterium]
MKVTAEQIHAYVDGELTPEEAGQVEAALAADAACRAEAESARLVKDCLTAKCAAHDCRVTWQKSMDRLNELDKARTTETFIGRYSWAFAAAVLAFIILAAGVNRMSGRTDLEQASMASLFSGLNVMEGAERDPLGKIRGAFGGIDCDIRPEALDIQEIAYGQVAGRRAVRMAARDSRGPIVLVMVEGVERFEGFASAGRDLALGKMNGVNGVAWTDGPVGIAAFANREPERLLALAQAIRGR